LAVYLLGFALCLIPLSVAAGTFQVLFHLGRRLVALRRATFTVSTPRARPGDTLEVRAHVVPRGSRVVTVQARLTCTMFDHRSHELYASSRTMRALPGAPNEYRAPLVLPEYALRTGLVGDKLPNPYGDRTRRMLVVWTVDFEVRSARGAALYRTSRGVEVPRGRRPKTHLRRMSLLAMDTFSSIRNDMLFNWLVHLAACDSAVSLPERNLLHGLLEEMHGMLAPGEADARIERELQRRLVIDDTFLQRYVPLDSRLDFYRALLTLAVSDGAIDEREEKFLTDALKSFRLTSDDVKQVREEVTGGQNDGSTS
jgi:uncharacterized tellurite resistance protein B-like protein